jgi:hypothetical protein
MNFGPFGNWPLGSSIPDDYEDREDECPTCHDNGEECETCGGCGIVANWRDQYGCLLQDNNHEKRL